MSKFRFSTVMEVLEFLNHTRKWWLLPILIVLAGVSLFIVMTEGSAVLPFIYALF